MTLTWHCLVALAVLAPFASGACKPIMYPMIGAVSTKVAGNYAVVIDAGSSGSRIRVYSWEDERDLFKLPNILEVYCYPKNPGVSDCATHQDLTNHILELVGMAAEHVPATARNSSSISFMATAGMRMMPEEKAKDAISVIDGLLKNQTLNPFRYVPSPDNPRILSGEEEGLFAWIAANYLAKAFDTYGKRNWNTTGVLELGGASTQIAFAPKGSILAYKFPVHLAGVTYNLYVHSYLIYGQEMVDNWIRGRVLHDAQPPSHNLTVANPCMLKGDVSNKTNVTYYGTGDPARCSQLLDELIYTPVEPWRCNPKPCAIGTAYQPTIHPKQQFLAVGAFRYPLSGLRVVDSEGRFSLNATTKAAFNFCSTHIDTIRSNRKIPTTVRSGDFDPSRYLSKECLTGLYMPILFTKAYRFKDEAQQIRAPPIGSPEIEWPLGAVIYEYERTRCRPHCFQAGHACPTVVGASSTIILSLRVYLGYVLIYGLGLPAIFRFLS